MRRVNLYEFVELGEAIAQASKVTKDYEPLDAYMAVYDLKRLLTSQKIQEKIEFGHLDHYVSSLIKSIDDVFKKYSDKDDNGESFKVLGFGPYYSLSRSLQEFKTILSAECRSLASYVVAKVGIYSTNDLIEKSSQKFSENTKKNICDNAIVQFQEAARCLSFGLYTACGFHMMRAIEYVLLDLLKIICGKNFEYLNANWGAYIKKIEEIHKSGRRKKPKMETVDLLRQIKDNHRNPVIHADSSLSSQEAMDIFDLGSVVISHLSDEIKRLKLPSST